MGLVGSLRASLSLDPQTRLAEISSHLRLPEYTQHDNERTRLTFSEGFA